MENNLNNDKNFDKAHKDPRQGNPQDDQEQQIKKGQQENQEDNENKNWDQVQRRQQAAPRSYNENLDSENIENQNTEAHNEQRDEGDKVNDEERGETEGNKEDGFQGYGQKLVGDKASERQQTMDETNSPKDRKENKS